MIIANFTILILVSFPQQFLLIINKLLPSMMRKRYNYNVDFASEAKPDSSHHSLSECQHVSPRESEYPRKMNRKYGYSNQGKKENELPYRNCVGRYRNAYHFMLKQELKVHSRNMFYLRRGQSNHNEHKNAQEVENSPRELRELFNQDEQRYGREEQIEQIEQQDYEVQSSRATGLVSRRSFQKIHTISEQGDEDDLDSIYAMEEGEGEGREFGYHS